MFPGAVKIGRFEYVGVCLVCKKRVIHKVGSFSGDMIYPQLIGLNGLQAGWSDGWMDRWMVN